VPGDPYPILFTENTRIGLPRIETLARVLGDDLWPEEGFDGKQRRPGDSPIPKSWMALALGDDFVAPRLGPVETFYDTTDTPEGLIDRFGAAHGQWIRRCLERYRRGRPAHDPHGPRRTMGHYLWKLNNTWPMVYSNIVDAFDEPTQAYYALARAHRPVLLCFDFPDHALLWCVNDTPDPVRGTVRVEVQALEDGAIQDTLEARVDVPAGASQVVLDLTPLGMFFRRHALIARLRDDGGHPLAESIDFADIERKIPFPSPTLSLELLGEAVRVTTDAFARRLRLAALDSDGDHAGFYFGDNFFDLPAGGSRVIPIFGPGEDQPRAAARITASTPFSEPVTAYIDASLASASTPRDRGTLDPVSS
jgi:hypothetical protein